MIFTLTANPALDITYRLAEVTLGHSHRVNDIRVRPGGKGLNTAFTVAQMGYDVGVCAPLGGEPGHRFETLVSELSREVTGKISAHWVWGSHLTRSSIAVYSPASTTVFNEAGPSLDPVLWIKLAQILRANIRAGDVLSINGSLPQNTDPGVVGELVQVAQTHGARVIVDSSGPALLAGARAGAQILKPNEHELREATGETDIFVGARALLDLGAKALVVSCGEAGLLHISGRDGGTGGTSGPLKVLAARPPQALQGNPTGAGDALVAGLLVGLHENLGSDEQLRLGVAWSAAAVLRPVAGQIDEQAARDFVAQVQVETVDATNSAQAVQAEPMQAQPVQATPAAQETSKK